ncbi:hypothetical protein HY837_03890 [archaeon]|nr:hypothetical protein [archaeon]
MKKMIDTDPVFWEDLKWGETHHTELLENYRDKWVAINNKVIVAAGEDLSEVMNKAKSLTGKEEVPVLFIDCGDHVYGQAQLVF